MTYIEATDVKFHFVDKDNGEYVIVLDTPLKFYANGTSYVIENGYESNGMSVPRCLWSIISPQYSPRTLFPSIVHDWMYGHYVMPREEVDKWYKDALIENKYPEWKASLVYEAVRMFGGSHWVASDKKD